MPRPRGLIGRGTAQTAPGATFLSPYLLFVLGLAVLSACTVSYPVFGRFDDSPVLLRGRLQARTIGGLGSLELEDSDGRIRCVSQSDLKYAPPGETGRITFKCQNGRTVEALYTVTGWGQGYGRGHDEGGRGFRFAFGVPESEALKEMGESP